MQRAAALRLPAIYQFPEEAKEDGFAAYGPSFLLLYRDMVTSKLVRLLRGAKPADLPVEQPTKFDLVINLKTAKALWPHDAGIIPAPRRRGDRISMLFCCGA
jgi:putative tryptophan/tyrosine transport system substrate-binding protein